MFVTRVGNEVDEVFPILLGPGTPMMADSVAVIVVDGVTADANEHGVFIHPSWAPRRDMSFVHVIFFDEVVEKFCIVVQSLRAVFRIVVFRVVVFRVVVFLNVEVWLLVSCLVFGSILELDLALLATVGSSSTTSFWALTWVVMEDVADVIELSVEAADGALGVVVAFMILEDRSGLGDEGLGDEGLGDKGSVLIERSVLIEGSVLMGFVDEDPGFERSAVGVLSAGKGRLCLPEEEGFGREDLTSLRSSSRSLA